MLSDESTLTKDLNNESTAFASLASQPIGDQYGIYKDSGTVVIDQQIQSFTSYDANVANVGIVNLSGHVTFEYQASPVFTVNASDTTSFNPSYTTTKTGFVSQIITPYINNDGQHPYSIVYAFSSSELQHDIDQEILHITIFSLLGLLIVLLVFYELMNRLFVNPLQYISRSALFISQGHYEQQIVSSRTDEIGDLVKSVNTMAGSLNADITKLKEVDSVKNEFIMITSHELRTPLTVIKGSIELLDSLTVAPEVRNRISAIGKSAERLGYFAEEMVTIAGISVGTARVDMQPTTITDLLGDLYDIYLAESKARSQQLLWEIDRPEQIVVVSALHLRSAIRNLLDNAVKFTAEHGVVALHISVASNVLKITISDTGIGIEPKELAQLFTAFHRGTSTLEYNYGGAGIGLYSSKLIVQAQGGRINVTSELKKGSTFVIEIPQPTRVPIVPPAMA